MIGEIRTPVSTGITGRITHALPLQVLFQGQLLQLPFQGPRQAPPSKGFLDFSHSLRGITPWLPSPPTRSTWTTSTGLATPNEDFSTPMDRSSFLTLPGSGGGFIEMPSLCLISPDATGIHRFHRSQLLHPLPIVQTRTTIPKPLWTNTQIINWLPLLVPQKGKRKKRRR